MGSVQMCIECEQCSYEFAMDDYNYRTGERLTFCPRCGYKKSYTYETDESGNFVMKTDLHEIDEKTIGYIPKGPSFDYVKSEMELLKRFCPFSRNITQEELNSIDKKAYIVKTDSKKEEIEVYLSFWYNRKIIKEDSKTFLQHTHPVPRQEEKQGHGICCLGGALYYLEDLGVEKALELAKESEYKEHSYVTQFRDGKLEVLYGEIEG